MRLGARLAPRPRRPLPRCDQFVVGFARQCRGLRPKWVRVAKDSAVISMADRAIAPMNAPRRRAARRADARYLPSRAGHPRGVTTRTNTQTVHPETAATEPELQ